MERLLNLPIHQAQSQPSTFVVASTASMLLKVVQTSAVLICCLDDHRKSLEIATMCATEGTHFVGKVEQPTFLRRTKNLHFLAKLNSCSIVPTCNRDVTMSELGLFALAIKFSPGTLLEASLFRPLPTAYKALFWDTVLLASEKITTTLAATPSRRTNSKHLLPLEPLETPRPLNEIPTPLIPSISVTSDDMPSSSNSGDRMKYISSYDNLASALDPKWNGLDTSATRMHAKAKSFGDLEQLEAASLEESTSLPSVSQHIRSHSLKIDSTRKIQRSSQPSSTKCNPLFPSMNHVIQSPKLVSQIVASPKHSEHPVVQQSIETTHTQLSSARRSLTPTVLESTSLLPEASQGRHRIELHHLSTIGAGSKLFSLLLRVLLFIFLLFPLVRRWLTAWAPLRGTQPGQEVMLSRQEQIAKAQYYLDRSPTTMTMPALRAANLHNDVRTPLSKTFRAQNSQPVVVGAIGSIADYLASSSTQSNEKLKFAEVRAPGHLGPSHATAICTALCAIALATSPPNPRSTGVVPPLSAGGKILKDLLIAEGFTTRNVSFGRK